MYGCIWWCKASVDCAIESPTQGFPSSLQMKLAAGGIVVVRRSTYVNAVYGSLQICQRGLLLRNSQWWLLGVVAGSERVHEEDERRSDGVEQRRDRGKYQIIKE